MEIGNWRSYFKSKFASNPQAQKMSLRECLESGIINWIEYSLWAKNAFQLALLSDDFSSHSSPDLNFWKQLQQSYKWSENALPVAQWDGIVYVACLEKPTNLPSHFQPVLASPSLLANFWQNYHQSGHRSSFQAPTSITATASVPTSASFSAPAEQASPPDSLDGLDMDMLKTLVSPAPQDDFASILEDAPAAAPSEESLSLDNEELDLGGVETSNSVKLSPAAESAPEGFEEVATPTKLFEISKEQKAEPISSEPVLGANASDFPVLAANPNFLKEKKNVIQKAKTAVARSYQSCLFMLVNQDQTKAYVVNDKFEIDNQNPVALTTPNCFNLSVSTQKEYHGAVVKNQSIEKFFEDWNQSEIPENLSIVPLVVRGMVLGLFVAMGDRKTYSNDCLSLVENSVAEILDPSANSTAA